MMGRFVQIELRYKTITDKYYRIWYDSIEENPGGGI